LSWFLISYRVPDVEQGLGECTETKNSLKCQHLTAPQNVYPG